MGRRNDPVLGRYRRLDSQHVRSNSRRRIQRLGYSTVRQAVRDWRDAQRKRAVYGFVQRWWHVLAFIACFAALGIGILHVQRLAEDTQQVAQDNKEVLCAAADVVKYGSPIQFPGESDAHYAKYLAAGARFLKLADDIDCKAVLRDREP